MDSPAPELATTLKAKSVVKRRRRRLLRLVLMPLLPIIIAFAAAWYWATESRYVSSDNAYVKRPVVQVSADVAGRIVAVDVSDGQRVKAGDVLFSIDPAPYRAKLATDQAAVATARLHIGTLKAALREAEAKLPGAKEAADYARGEFARQQALLSSGGTSKATYDQAQHQMNAAVVAEAEAEAAIGSARAALGGNPDAPVDSQPEVVAAIAERDQDALDLSRTEMKAPVDGIVGNTALLAKGYYATPGIAIFSIVEDGKVWVEANLKETELTHLRRGQSAKIYVDAYPGRALEAKVDDIGGGTGAEFALLPPQNATGNWVKVVQRVPVRLTFDHLPNDIHLQSGLSVNVTVDTGYVSRIAADILGIARDAELR